MIEQAGAELFMFSTDYPHPEGGKDPLAKFEEALDRRRRRGQDRFYYRNMAELLGRVDQPAWAWVGRRCPGRRPGGWCRPGPGQSV